MRDARHQSPASRGAGSAGLAAVMLASDRHYEWGGGNAAYVRHLMNHGSVLVAEMGAGVAGLGATQPRCRAGRHHDALRSLAVAPTADDGAAAAVVLHVLASLDGPADEMAHVSLPGPHPAVRPLLAAGWTFDDFDLFMATEPSFLDPRRAVLSLSGVMNRRSGMVTVCLPGTTAAVPATIGQG